MRSFAALIVGFCAIAGTAMAIPVLAAPSPELGEGLWGAAALAAAYAASRLVKFSRRDEK